MRNTIDEPPDLPARWILDKR